MNVPVHDVLDPVIFAARANVCAAVVASFLCILGFRVACLPYAVLKKLKLYDVCFYKSINRGDPPLKIAINRGKYLSPPLKLLH